MTILSRNPILDLERGESLYRKRRKGLLKPSLVPTPLGEPGDRIPIGSSASPPRGFLAVLRPLLTIYLEWSRAASDEPEVATSSAHEIGQAFEDLRGVWTKVGQLLSLRPDLLPPAVGSRLAQLQDRVPAFEPALSREILEEEYQLPLAYVFDRFVEHPIAAGSIGQVHLARLRDEKAWVTVKIRRPGIRELFERDLKFFERIARLLRISKRFRHYRWEEGIHELHNIVTEEVDYRYEADSMKLLRDDLKSHRKIYVPKVFETWSSDRVLVTEHMHGVFLNQYLQVARQEPDVARTWREVNRIEPEKVARNLFRSFCQQVFEGRSFHADLQPSNIVLLRKNWVSFVDFGSVGRMELDLRTDLHDVLFYVSQRAYDDASQKMLTLSEPLPLIDPEALRKQFLRTFRTWDQRTEVREFPYEAKSLVTLWQTTGEVSHHFKIPFRWSLLRFDRAMMTLDDSLRDLWPEVNYPEALKGYFLGANQRRIQNFRQPKSLLRLGGRWLAFLRHTPGQIRDLQRDFGSLYQRRATNFEASSSKISYLFERFFSECRFTTGAAAFVLFLTWLHQRGDVFHFAWAEASENRIDDLFLYIPHLSGLEWGIVFALVGWLWIIFHRLVRRFSTKDSQLPGSTQPVA